MTLTLLLLAFCTIQQPASQATSRNAPDLVVLHINDFHGQVLPRTVTGDPRRPAAELGGYATLQRYVEQQRASVGKENVWVTDAGDWFQGTPEGNEDKGASIIECFNRLGLTASEIGNHDFDFGEANLARLVPLAKHPVLGANIFDAKKPGMQRSYAKPFVVLTHSGVRVAIVGLITKDTKHVSTGPFGDAEFHDEVATLRELLPRVKQESDVCVLLTHCGVDTDRVLAQTFPEIPLILGGHSHTALKKGIVEGRTLIVQSGSKGTAITRVALKLSVTEPRLVVIDNTFVDLRKNDIGVDAAAAVFVKEHFGALSVKWDEVIGKVEGDLGRGRDRSPNSTAAGNMLAGLIRAVGGAQIGLTNKGGIRTTLALGPISRRQIYELVPFENSVVAFEISGKQLKQVLQHALGKGLQPLEIDGASYEYAIRDGERVLRRVTLASGDELKDEGVVKIATNSFLADGGEGITVFRGAKRLPQTARMQRYLRDLLVESVTEHGALRVTGEDRIRNVN